MNKFTTEMGMIGKEEISISSEGRKLSISIEENNSLYIGFYGGERSSVDVTFSFTKEDGELYKQINDLYRNITEDRFTKNKVINEMFRDGKNEDELPGDREKVVWISEDYTDKEEASVLTIEKNESAFDLTFHRSSSKNRCNSYFVRIKIGDSKYKPYNLFFIKLYTTLLDLAREQEGRSRVRVPGN